MHPVTIGLTMPGMVPIVLEMPIRMAAYFEAKRNKHSETTVGSNPHKELMHCNGVIRDLIHIFKGSPNWVENRKLLIFIYFRITLMLGPIRIVISNVVICNNGLVDKSDL
jgi:hypothetical protein